MPASENTASRRKAPHFRLPILGYHYVGTAAPGIARHLCVSTAELERQLDSLLGWGFTTVRIEDVIAAFDGTRPLPSKPVLLTFDDGYAELANTAFPGLRGRGMTATVFVVTRRLGMTNTWDTRPGDSGVPLLSDVDVRYWHSQGIQFGAHTRTHRSLPELTSEERNDEIAGSKTDLQVILGNTIDAFAYPYGHTDRKTAQDVADRFRFACSSWHGVNDSRTEPWMLRRSMVEPGDSRLAFRCHLRFGRVPWRVTAHHATPAKLLAALRTRGTRW